MLGLDIRDSSAAYSYFQQFTAALDSTRLESIEEFQFVLQITFQKREWERESVRECEGESRGVSREIKQAD